MVTAIAFTSCSKDDDAAPANTGSFTFNGKQITIQSAEIDDFGPTSNGDFHNYEFYFEGTDGTTTSDISFDLFSPLEDGTTGFTPGTFNFAEFSSNLEPGTFYFTSASVSIGDEVPVSANGGKIVVAGTGNNYNVTVDLTFPDESTLTLTYSGAFIVFPFISIGN